MLPRRKEISPSLPAYPPARLDVPTVSVSNDQYEVCFASSPDELDRIQKLRFEIFNLEMNEGMERSYATGRDRDDYDRWMHHLYIRDRQTGEIVGTYRMQQQEVADLKKGFYTDDEYKLSDYAPDVARNGVEIGRACVHGDHRSGDVLNLLWKGIAFYLDHYDKEYLFGCTSLATQNKKKASMATQILHKKGHYDEQRLIPVKDRYKFDLPRIEDEDEVDVEIPRLLLVYIRYGAKVCSLPALDPDFGTIDFLTIFDLEDLPESARRRFF